MTTAAYGIESTFPFYPGLDGRPLQGGSVWFGIAGQNPVTSPQTVYSDPAGTQPIAQPIAISNGRTVDAYGNPVSVYTVGDFSRLVQDNQGRQLLFQASQPTTLSASQAQNWAQFTGGDVPTQPAGSRSAKSWSQDNLAGATYGGSSKDWAQSASLPDGVSKSAKSYSADAASSATSSAASATSAANYAAAAATGAKFFNTIALGNAGVIDAATFGVIAGGTDALLRPTIYRRESAGVSTALYSVLPASEYDANFVNLTPPGYKLAIADQDGKTVFGLTDAGVTQATTLQATTLNGAAVTTIIAGAAAATGFSGASIFAADIVHIPLYGQSLSTGVSTDAVITTVQRFNNLRFSGGVRAQDAGASPAGYTSLVPLIETDITPAESEAAGTHARETCGAGMSDYIRELIASEDGLVYTAHNYQILVSAPGIGGMPISALSKPSTWYTRLLADVSHGYSLAQAAGKTYKVPAFCWLQGESDGATAVATYLAALEQLRSDFNADVQAINGQTETVQMVIYQTAPTSNSQLAQLQAVETYPNIHMAGPHYHLATVDGTHFTGLASKIYGAYLGRAVKRVCIDGKSWDPVRPLSLYKQGALAYVKFNLPKGVHYPLVFDTSLVAAQTNMGFSMVDSLGGALTVSSVALTGPDTVRITAAATIPAGAKLRYAIAAPLGNLRDSAGNLEIFDGGGINYALHNWAAAFEKTIP